MTDDFDFRPAGIIRQSPIKMWPAHTIQAKTSVLQRVHLRRLLLKMIETRHTPPHAKLTRRARRRWRGQGGRWAYDPHLEKLFREALQQSSLGGNN